MTREEAINIISQMIKDEEGFLSDNTVEAHKMAIQALEQQTCEDAVSREAVLGLFAQNADAARPYSIAWNNVVTAWMPLPKPYELQESEVSE